MKTAKIEMHKFPVRMLIALSSPEWKKLSHRNYTSKRLSILNNSRVIFRRSRQFWRKISWIATIAITIQISKDRSKIRIPNLLIETSQENFSTEWTKFRPQAGENHFRSKDKNCLWYSIRVQRAVYEARGGENITAKSDCQFRRRQVKRGACQ